MLLVLAAELRPQATPVRQADATCARCHASLFRSYLDTPMANASGLAAENLKTATFVHNPSGVTYSVSNGNGKAVLEARDGSTSMPIGKWTLSYFLGSGHLGITYLYSVDHYLFESPVAWYAASRSYDMKPGLGEMRERPPALPMESGCLRCHMSEVQASDRGTINRFQAEAFLHTGITCEMCHGDSSEHVRSAGKAAIVNPARLEAASRDSICISCHLEGDVSVERAGRSALDYRPGELISSYLAYYVRGGASLTARGVSEVEQLSQSTCKRVSGDRMSCTSCHNPHFTPAPTQRAAFFRARCLACHSQAGFAISHHPENPDCTSCHMPRTGAENIPHVAWTDHRILREPDKRDLTTAAKSGDELVPIFSPGATTRDLAMAYYKLLLEGERSYEPRAWELLHRQQDAIANDAAGLDALGNLSAERGDNQAAEQAFRRVLTLDPSDLTALSNLGTLLAKQGRLNDSMDLLRKAFGGNRDVSGLAMNLARVECMAGQSEAAHETLRDALVYNPDLKNLRQLNEQLTSCNAPKSR